MAKTRYLRRLLLDSDVSIPLMGGNRTTGSHHGDANFDGNMVIILAALLCALTCALGLSDIARCARRCARAYAYEAADEAAVGVKKRTLRHIPVVVYKSGLHIPATDCPICLGEFVEGEDVRILPKCSDGFHVKCIDQWLAVHCSCPTCRRPLNEPSPAAHQSRMCLNRLGSGLCEGFTEN